ncbi:MAG TPA: alpha/beta hydrolase [Candidatus Saccharimonadales bacterium]|nr:alpha/beta hydrolase [Candidatus Saccharimonadales bacterium]
MKTVLFVPGFQEDKTSRDYAATIQAIEKRGYTVQFVAINWKRTTIKYWTRELDKVYAKYEPGQTILAGFSFGAMTAFMAATKRNPAELWLFSLSPYFAEDAKDDATKEKWLKTLGKRRTTGFCELNFNHLSQSLSCKTSLFVGQLEIDQWPETGERARQAHARIQDSELHVVQGAGHDVTHPQYIEVLSRHI